MLTLKQHPMEDSKSFKNKDSQWQICHHEEMDLLYICTYTGMLMYLFYACRWFLRDQAYLLIYIALNLTSKVYRPFSQAVLQSSHPAHCHLLPQSRVLVRTGVRHRRARLLDSGIYSCCPTLSLTSAAVGQTWSPVSSCLSCPFSRCCLAAGLGRGERKKKKNRKGGCWHHQ